MALTRSPTRSMQSRRMQMFAPANLPISFTRNNWIKNRPLRRLPMLTKRWMQNTLFGVLTSVVILFAADAALAQAKMPPLQPKDDVKCANENEACKFAGEKIVKYGADKRWIEKTFSNGVDRSNEVFGDQAPGIAKACYIKGGPSPFTKDEQDPPTPAPQPQPNAEFVKCANENEGCKFAGEKIVKYGADKGWIEKTFSNGVDCSNKVFGDPAPGIAKACYIKGGQNPLPPIPAPQPQPNDEFVKCANENEECKFAGEKIVKYGADKGWIEKTFSNGVDCSNKVFGDPAPGIAKACYIKGGKGSFPPIPAPQPQPNDEFVKCANENEQCKFAGEKIVKYGADKRWIEKTFSNGVDCSNDVFGDPAPGIAKACYIKGGQNPPAPAPQPQPQAEVKCANENEQCKFVGEKIVKYGADKRWIEKTFSDGVACSNDVFGDPASGTAKACFIKGGQDLPTPAPQPA